MKRNEAMKWFWPFLAAAAIAVGVSAFVQAKMMSTASETRLRIASPQNAPQVEPMHVVLEPIVVVGRRSASPLEARADPPSRGKQPG
jgi:hypothetical protein